MNVEERGKAGRTSFRGILGALAVLSLSLGLVPQAHAITPNVNFNVGQPGFHQNVYTQQVDAISGVISAGGIAVSINFPPDVASSSTVWKLGGFLSGPGLVSALVPDTFTWTVSALNGCTAGTGTTVNTATVTTDTSAFTIPMTMTGTECEGILTVTQDVGAAVVRIANIPMAFNVYALDYTQNVDAQNRLCAASNRGTSCTTPAMTISGTMTLSGSLNAVVSGTLDVLDRLCAAAPTGTTCTVGTILECSTAALAADDHACDINTQATFKGNQTTIIPSTIHIATDSLPEGFWELFGPTLLCVIILFLLDRAPLWVVPAALALGIIVFLLAFSHANRGVILLQATSGTVLGFFSLYALSLRWLEVKKLFGQKLARRVFD